jgi:hypothetical protein
MWPRMLFELLPHFARLVPMADRFLTSQTASEKAQEAALAGLSDSLRGGMGQVTEAHAGIMRTLKEQSAQVSEIAVEATRARIAVESVEARVARLERTTRFVMLLLVVVLVLVAAGLVPLAIAVASLVRR